MHYKNKKVAFNMALAKGELNDEAIEKIVKGADKVLN